MPEATMQNHTENQQGPQGLEPSQGQHSTMTEYKPEETRAYTPKLVTFDRTVTTISPDVDWKEGLLVRSTNWLGDALMTLPAVAQMRQHVPDAKKLFVLSPKNLAPMWEACPFVDQVVPMAGKHISPVEVQQVRNLNPGVAIVLPNSFGSAMDVWKTHIPVRLGRRGRWRRLLLTQTIDEWPRGENVGQCHQLSYYLELASMLGNVQLTDQCPHLQVDTAEATRLGMTEEDRWLAIAPGAAYGPAKQWPADSFADVAQWFQKTYGKVIILGGPREREVAEHIQRKLNPTQTLNLAGKTNLTQLMAALNRATLVLANDSGAMHLAAGLGKTGVAIFGSTDPIATGPIGGTWSLLVANVPCRPCFKRTCQLPESNAYRCLRSITPLNVKKIISIILS